MCLLLYDIYLELPIAAACLHVVPTTYSRAATDAQLATLYTIHVCGLKKYYVVTVERWSLSENLQVS